MEQKRNSSGVFTAVVITILSLFLIGLAIYTYSENQKKTALENNYIELQEKVNEMTEKSVANVELFQETLSNMKQDLLKMAEGTESNIIEDALKKLQITISRKDTIPKIDNSN